MIVIVMGASQMEAHEDVPIVHHSWWRSQTCSTIAYHSLETPKMMS